jgi:L-ascorbate metabolism protein UlaG (beta-lactamase superfamily)
MVHDARTSADRIVFLGHSTVLVELDGVALLTDPVLRGRVAHLVRRAAPADLRAAALADVVLISHLHYDHLDVPSLRLLGEDICLAVPRGARQWLRGRGFERVTELDVGERMTVGSVTVTAVPARHGGSRRPLGPRSGTVGYVLRGRRTIYFAGDTALFDDMSKLAPGLDVALLPVAGWGRRLGPGHMNARDAARAVAMLNARLAIPIHWGTLAPIGTASRRRDPPDAAPREFAEQVARSSPSTEVKILAPGEQIPL